MDYLVQARFLISFPVSYKINRLALDCKYTSPGISRREPYRIGIIGRVGILGRVVRAAFQAEVGVIGVTPDKALAQAPEPKSGDIKKGALRARDIRDTRDARDAREARVDRDSRDGRETRVARETREVRVESG